MAQNQIQPSQQATVLFIGLLPAPQKLKGAKKRELRKKAITWRGMGFKMDIPPILLRDSAINKRILTDKLPCPATISEMNQKVSILYVESNHNSAGDLLNVNITRGGGRSWASILR
jgi:hypothetical protein